MSDRPPSLSGRSSARSERRSRTPEVVGSKPTAQTKYKRAKTPTPKERQVLASLYKQGIALAVSAFMLTVVTPAFADVHKGDSVDTQVICPSATAATYLAMGYKLSGCENKQEPVHIKALRVVGVSGPFAVWLVELPDGKTAYSLEQRPQRKA